MKQRLLSVLAFASLTMAGIAQTWTEPVAPTAPADGTPVEWVADGETSYYIKNVGCGQYLMGANSWATQISVSSDGAPLMKVVIEECGDDTYPDAVKIKVNGTFRFYGGNGYEGGRDMGNCYLFRDGEESGFIDHNAQACWYWNIIPSSNDGNYYIQSAPTMGGFNNDGDQYVVAQGPGQACLMNGSNNDAMSEWQFINSEGVDLNALEKYSADMKAYEARVKLYNLYLDAVKYGANTDAAGVVYNNSAATAEEIDAARVELLALMPAAVIAYATANGTAANPAEMPYVLYNADFSEGNINGWIIERPEGASGNYQYQGASYTSLDEQYTIKGFIESWVPAPNHLSDGKIYQKVGGLPNGHYILECDAMALNQTDETNNPDEYVDKEDYTGVYLYYSDGTITMHGDALASDRESKENEETGDFYNVWHPAHFVYEFDLSTTSDTVMIGLMAEATNLNWMGADNFVLKFAGSPQSLPSFTALLGEITSCENYLATDPLAQNAVIDALKAAIQEAKGLTAGGADEAKDAQYQAAFTKLEQARAAVAASVEAYAKIDAFLVKLSADEAKYANNDVYQKLTNKIGEYIDKLEEGKDNRTLSTEEINEIINGYDAAIEALVKEIFADIVAAGQPLTEGFEITSMFSDMSYAYGTTQTAFANGYPAENPVWIPVDDAGNPKGEDNFKTNYSTAEVWNNRPFNINRVFTNLPKGKYTIQTMAFHRVEANDANYPNYLDGLYDYENEDYAYIYANGRKQAIINVAEIASTDVSYPSPVTVDEEQGLMVPNNQQSAYQIFTEEQYAELAEKCVVEVAGIVAEDGGSLSVGVVGTDNLQGNHWTIWYDWRLFYWGEDPSMLGEAIQDLIAQAEELDAFYAKDAQAKLEAAIQAGRTAIDNDDTAAKSAAIVQLNEAINYVKQGEVLYTKMKELADKRAASITEFEEKGWSFSNTTVPTVVDQVVAIDIDLDPESAADTNAQMEEWIATMTEGWAEYLWSNEALPTASLENPVDMTDAIITNATFDTNSKDGWTIVNPADATKSPEYGGTWADEVAEFWNAGPVEVKQNVKMLKDGYWRLSADALFRTTGDGTGEANMVKEGTPIEDNTMFLYVRYPNFYKEVQVVQWSDLENGAIMDNEENAELFASVQGPTYVLSGSEEEGDLQQFIAPNTRGNFITFYEQGRYHNVVDFGYPTAGEEITIGIVIKEADKNNWCPFDNFKLEYLGTEAPDAVSDIAAKQNAGAAAIFGIDGRQQSTFNRGINIVRMSDGTVRKVLVK